MPLKINLLCPFNFQFCFINKFNCMSDFFNHYYPTPIMYHLIILIDIYSYHICLYFIVNWYLAPLNCHTLSFIWYKPPLIWYSHTNQLLPSTSQLILPSHLSASFLTFNWYQQLANWYPFSCQMYFCFQQVFQFHISLLMPLLFFQFQFIFISAMLLIS